MIPGASDFESFRSVLAEFDRHTDDLLHADPGSFDNNLQRLVDFQRNNRFTQELFSKLKVLNYEAFMMETSRLRGALPHLGRLDWPMGIHERVGFQTRLLTDLAKGEFDLVGLLYDFYSQTGDIHRDLRVFQDQLLRPYLRDYRLLLVELEPTKPVAMPPKPLIPNFGWYSAESQRCGLAPRCPYANVHTCPRYYDSLVLLGDAGAVKLPDAERKRLDALWEDSPLVPVSGEQAAGVFSANGRVSDYHRFCPEILFDRFGLFVTYLSRYADESDAENAAQRLRQEGASADDPRWTWSAATPQHYSECPLYSPLLQDWPKLIKRIPSVSPLEDRYDVFISHASEDKEDFVRPLALVLTNLGLRVWYDEWTLALGDSLRKRIDAGLASANYGVVILSRDFFAKKWPEAELDGLFALETEGRKVILPIWHRVTKQDVLKYSPMIVGKLAAHSDEGVTAVAAKIYGVARPLDKSITAESIAAKAQSQNAYSATQPLSDLLHTLSDVAPLLHKLDEPVEGIEARIFLGALQVFFCGSNLLTLQIDKDLRFGVDNLLRVISQVHERDEHRAYLFGKLVAARNSFETYRSRLGIGFELEPIDASKPSAAEMQRLHGPLGAWLEVEKKMTEDDRLAVRLTVALLDYGRHQHYPHEPFPPLSPAIHRTLREMLTRFLARYLNVAVPDHLENILTADVKGYCRLAWDDLEDFEYGPARRALRTLRDWLIRRMPWNRAKRVRAGDLID